MSKKELKQSEERTLDYVMTDDEVRIAGEELASEFLILQDLIKEASRINARKKPVEIKIEKLVNKIDTKIEARQVECDWHFNWNTGKKKLIRSDTGETIDTLDITENERQIQLELES